MKRETEARWAERVKAWRASGQSSKEFVEGRGFSASGLRHWSYRLRKSEGLDPAGEVPVLRLARVERPQSSEPIERAAPTAVEAAEAGAVWLQVGAVRVDVRRGFDGDTLAAVLDVLERRGQR